MTKMEIFPVLLVLLLFAGCSSQAVEIPLTNGRLGTYDDPDNYFWDMYSIPELEIKDFAEYGVDINSDNLIDRVYYKMTANITESGRYHFVLDMFSPEFVGAYAYRTLSIGQQVILFNVSSDELFSNKTSSRYIFRLRTYYDYGEKNGNSIYGEHLVYLNQGFFASHYFVEDFYASHSGEKAAFEKCRANFTKSADELMMKTETNAKAEDLPEIELLKELLKQRMLVGADYLCWSFLEEYGTNVSRYPLS